ncbi:polysaccharide biosynthesis/export family protein [Tsuneonella mangrovi]|uniref:polysaccharide biosynthesis/export family protein n=1 Tax=Tsuneonella mangrovi TaxID=1982042 RepID=UPI001F0A7AA3|nr:polysaccharide biosynthesis/export family protein [Tsuneonella mangrovi]
MALLLLVLTGCAGNPPLGGGKDVAVADTNGLPAPTAADMVSSARDYLIGPFDKLHIDVFGIEDLQRDVQIDAAGQLSYPLIGVVQAAGQTPQQLAATIADKLRGKYVRDPQVTVNLTETVSQVITVDGQVNKPGLYPVVGKMTLMRAVATAGGADEYAKLDDVVVFRKVDGQQMVGLYNLEGIRRGNYADPEIYANDVIIVSTSRARRLFKDILQGSSLITTPIIFAIRTL